MRSALRTVARRWAIDQRGAVGGELFQRFLNERFAFRIERAGRLIEQQDRRIAQNGAGDGDALALAAGQGDAALAHFGVIALGKFLGELIDAGGAGCGHGGFARCIGLAEADVVEHRAGENHRVLRHDGDALAHLLRIGRLDIDAIDLRCVPAAGSIEALDQGEDRGLAGSRGPDDGDGLAGLRP